MKKIRFLFLAAIVLLIAGCSLETPDTETPDAEIPRPEIPGTFKISYEYGQRVQREKREVLLEDEIISALKKSESITYNYESSSVKKHAVQNYSEEYKLKSFKWVDSTGFNSDFCSSRGWSSDIERETIDSSYLQESSISFYVLKNDTANLEKLYRYEHQPYDINIHCTQEYANRWDLKSSCHMIGITSYSHPFFRLLETKIEEKSILFQELNNHFETQKSNIISTFEGISQINYEIHGQLNVYKSENGVFRIKENQENKEYATLIEKGESLSVELQPLNITSEIGSFKEINNFTTDLILQKYISTTKTPDFPMIRKIIVEWTEGVEFVEFVASKIETHTIVYDEATMLDVENKRAYMTVLENDITHPTAVLNEEIGIVIFLIDGVEVFKSLKVEKIQE